MAVPADMVAKVALAGRLGKFVERMLAITARPDVLEIIEPLAVIFAITDEVARIDAVIVAVPTLGFRRSKLGSGLEELGRRRSRPLGASRRAPMTPGRQTGFRRRCRSVAVYRLARRRCRRSAERSRAQSIHRSSECRAVVGSVGRLARGTHAGSIRAVEQVIDRLFRQTVTLGHPWFRVTARQVPTLNHISCRSRVGAVILISLFGVCTRIEFWCRPGGYGFGSMICRTPSMKTVNMRNQF
jgi:hypothetical protein